MKILISSDTYYPHINGCSYFGQRLAYYLQERGHEILVIAPGENMRGGFAEHNGVKIYGVRAVPLDYFFDNNFTFSPPVFIRKDIKKVIAEFQPDVVHLQGHFPVAKTVLNIAKELKIPVVGTNHFMPDNLVYYLHLPKKVEKYIEQKAWDQFRKIFEKLEVVTSPTQSAANLVYKMGFSKKVLPISNGIDQAKFNTTNDGTYLKARYALPDKVSLLYVGRISKEKNIDLLIRAFAVASKDTDGHFIIAGSGAPRASLEKLANELGVSEKITFTGFVPDVDLPNLYRTADCFVVAGTAELQCLVAMEAMASGLPVIGVNAVALPELIHHNENGFLFEHGDIQTMAEQMKKMLSDATLRAVMSQKSLEIISYHEIGKTMERFENVYAQAIKNTK